MFGKTKVVSLILPIVMILVLLCSVALAKEDSNRPVLVVGYGWYTGIPVGQLNNAELIAHDLAGQVIEGRSIEVVVNPVTWAGAIPPIIEAIERLNPILVIGMGTSGSSPCVRPEKYGCNTTYGADATFPTPVVRGKEVDGKRVYEPIDPAGPAWEEPILPLPLDDIVKAMLEAGVPTKAGSKSQKEGYPEDMWFSTAGSYMCNLEAYEMPKYIKANKLDTYYLYFHIGTQPKYRAQSVLGGQEMKPSMSLDVTTKGIRIAIETILKALK